MFRWSCHGIDKPCNRTLPCFDIDFIALIRQVFSVAQSSKSAFVMLVVTFIMTSTDKCVL